VFAPFLPVHPERLWLQHHLIWLLADNVDSLRAVAGLLRLRQRREPGLSHRFGSVP